MIVTGDCVTSTLSSFLGDKHAHPRTHKVETPNPTSHALYTRIQRALTHISDPKRVWRLKRRPESRGRKTTRRRNVGATPLSVPELYSGTAPLDVLISFRGVFLSPTTKSFSKRFNRLRLQEDVEALTCGKK